MPQVTIYHGPEWSAVYVDSVLQKVGQERAIEQWVLAEYDVSILHDDAFMLGQEDPGKVATTLGELNEYKKNKSELEKSIADLRDRANSLREKADLLNQKADDLEEELNPLLAKPAKIRWA